MMKVHPLLEKLSKIISFSICIQQKMETLSHQKYLNSKFYWLIMNFLSMILKFSKRFLSNMSYLMKHIGSRTSGLIQPKYYHFCPAAERHFLQVRPFKTTQKNFSLFSILLHLMNSHPSKTLPFDLAT